MSDTYILGYKRTPFGAFQGALSSVSAPQLGSTALRAVLEATEIGASNVSEVIMGCVLPAGVGQAPARQAAISAGIPEHAPAMTLNKVCGSGMQALILAARSIRAGDARIVAAGGMENMSQAPYYLPGARSGFRMGDQKAIDGMVFDGLWDPYNNQHMGLCAESCAADESISRQAQDDYAIESYRRAQAAQGDGSLAAEIAAVEVPGRRGPTTVSEDEGVTQVNFDKIPTLRTVFKKDGTVTAANASSINDGAAALLLGNEDTAKQHGAIARIVSYGHHAQAPLQFPTAPMGAMQQAMERAGWTVDDIDIFEINEAFAIVALANQQKLGIPTEKLNRWGGAIAIGHPIGASGARIVGTLVQQLRASGLKRGIASICIGGGEGTAICVELV